MFAGEVHPYADAFPMLGSDDLQALADDIAEHGLLHPLIVDADGRLLDGRNRLAACELAGVEPTFTVHEDDPLALIVTANTHRRQMTAGQVAAARAIALGEQGKRVGGRWEYGDGIGTNTESVAASYMQRAGVVLDHDLTLLREVLTGTESLPTAYDKVRARVKEAETKAHRLARLRDEAPDLAHLVEDGMAVEEAWAALQERTREQRETAEALKRANEERATALIEALALLCNITGDTAARYVTAIHDHASPSLLRMLGPHGFARTTLAVATSGLQHIEKELDQ